MDKKNIFFIVLFLGIVTAAVVLADTSTPGSTNVPVNASEFAGKALIYRYDHIECAVNLTDAQIDAIDTYLAGNLSSNKDVLATDLTTLAGYRDALDKTSFDSFVKDTVSVNVKSANDEIRDAKKQWRAQNLTNDTRTAFIAAIKTAISQYSQCNGNDYSRYAGLVLGYYDNTENNWNDNMNKLNTVKDRFNITDPNTDFGNVTQDLQDMINKLQTALGTGNVTIMRQALQDIREQNLHVWARFEQTRLQIYLDQMTDMSKRLDIDLSNITSINDTIHSLNPYIQPGNKYRDGEYNDVWNTFKDATKDMAQISKDILQHRPGMRNNTGNRTGNYGNFSGMRNNTGNFSRFNNTRGGRRGG